MQLQKPFFIAVLVNLVALSACDTEVEEGASLLTDLETGEQVMLKNDGENTLVTNVSTGETIVTKGNLAGTLSDEEYTAMAIADREAPNTATKVLDLEVANRPGVSPALSGNCQFSIKSSLTCKNRTKTGTKSVWTYIVASTYYVASEPIWIELWRDVPWSVFNEYYGKAYYTVQPGKTTYEHTNWKAATASGEYFVKVVKDWNGYWSFGSVTLSD